MTTPLKIAMIAPECVPFAKVGGLADVVGGLAKALCSAGHQVIIILPKYAAIDSQKYHLRPFLSPLGVWMGNAEEWCAVQSANFDGVPVYFIESDKYFGRDGLYHDAEFHDYRDNGRRFGFFTRAALQLCRDIGFAPDIVHAHDWQAALAAPYLKIWHWDDPILGGAASVVTIHNIAHQGKYPIADYDYLGLQWDNYTPEKFEDYRDVNFLKGGIYYADLITTVSPTYARETRDGGYGEGLAPFLAARSDRYIGIVNGLDYDHWNPASDCFIPAHYTAQSLEGKAICKQTLQQRLQLDEDPTIPIIGVVSRFVLQKGLNLLADSIESILGDMRVQFAILGAGEKGLEWFFGPLPGRYPGRVGSYIGYNEELAHLITAGSDCFLMPSYFEPCGLNQLYALKYGTLPIVRATGGLDDTVQQYDESAGTGTGFKFSQPSAHAVYDVAGWAVSTYYDRKEHFQHMIGTAMAQDFSWQQRVPEYLDAYAQAIANKRSL